jgi:hypothetical protein
MGEDHGHQTLVSNEKSNLGSQIFSTKEEIHWLQMGVQGQVEANGTLDKCKAQLVEKGFFQ